MARGHAFVSPSGAHRWMKCTVSVTLEQEFPAQHNDAADEGTAAHDLAEVELLRFLKTKTPEACDKARETIKKRTNSNGEVYWNPAMDEHVDLYVSYVIDKYLEAQKTDPAATLLVEQKLNLKHWIPEGSGYCDSIIIADGTMEVVDFKYGKGVHVEIEGNPQLRLYALGAYANLCWLYDIKTVVTTIVQPRNGGISSETISCDDLLAWGRKLKPLAQMAYNGEGEPVAGEHCLFCRAAPRCKALAEYNQEIARHRFKNPDLLTDEEISDILGRVDQLTSWAGKVKDYALDEAVNNGKVWPGWKLVEGRSNRTINDPDKAAKILMTEGFAKKDVYKPIELQGITNLEKLVGKKKLNELLKDVIIKPPGKPKLAREDDERPAIGNTAKDAFEKLDD